MELDPHFNPLSLRNNPSVVFDFFSPSSFLLSKGASSYGHNVVHLPFLSGLTGVAISDEDFVEDVRAVQAFPCWHVSEPVKILEVFPLCVLLLVTVSDDDGRVVAASGQTLIVLHQLVRLVDTEQLVASHPVTRPDLHVPSVGMSHTVNAVTRLEASDLAPLHVLRRQRVVHRDVVRDLLHEPLETLAPVLLPESFEVADVSVGQGQSLRATGVKVIFIIVPPNLHHSHVVLERG